MSLYHFGKIEKKDDSNSYDGSNYYQAKTLDGRTNILKFKLCHKYCIECKEFGLNDNDQKCINCKEDYTYDYLSYVNRFTNSCVPLYILISSNVRSEVS